MEATNNHNPDFKILEQGKDTKKTVDLIANWSGEFTKRIKTQCNSKKLKFTFTDAIERIEFHTKRDECFLTARNFLYNNPINQNDYVKYVSAYAYQSIKLDLKYFKYNVDKLEGYYKKVDRLILSARMDEIRLETLEIDLHTMKVMQCRGIRNKDSEYHARILRLMNKNMHLIKERLKPKKNGTKKDVNRIPTPVDLAM